MYIQVKLVFRYLSCINFDPISTRLVLRWRRLGRMLVITSTPSRRVLEAEHKGLGHPQGREVEELCGLKSDLCYWYNLFKSDLCEWFNLFMYDITEWWSWLFYTIEFVVEKKVDVTLK